MNRERMIQVVVVAAMLTVGLRIGWYFDTRPALDSYDSIATSNSFREWFWEHRSLDLLVQVALIFVGALCVAAVLPKHTESQPTHEFCEGAGATCARVMKEDK